MAPSLLPLLVHKILYFVDGHSFALQKNHVLRRHNSSLKDLPQIAGPATHFNSAAPHLPPTKALSPPIQQKVFIFPIPQLQHATKYQTTRNRPGIPMLRFPLALHPRQR